MSTCKICKDLEHDTLKKIYEDDFVIAVISPEPASPGHVWVIPRKHHPIFESLSDEETAQLFSITNKLSISMFEELQSQGTNIMVRNGTAAGQTKPHVVVDIIPRIPEDGLDLLWQPKQLTEEQMSTVELNIKEKAGAVGAFEENAEGPVIEENNQSTEVEDYLAKSLRRIP